MREYAVQRVAEIAKRVGWEKVARDMLDDMGATTLARVAKRLSVLNAVPESPEDWAMGTLLSLMDEPEAKGLIEVIKRAGVPYRDGQQLLSHCLHLRDAKPDSNQPPA